MGTGMTTATTFLIVNFALITFALFTNHGIKWATINSIKQYFGNFKPPKTTALRTHDDVNFRIFENTK